MPEFNGIHVGESTYVLLRATERRFKAVELRGGRVGLREYTPGRDESAWANLPFESAAFVVGQKGWKAHVDAALRELSDIDMTFVSGLEFPHETIDLHDRLLDSLVRVIATILLRDERVSWRARERRWRFDLSGVGVSGQWLKGAQALKPIRPPRGMKCEGIPGISQPPYVRCQNLAEYRSIYPRIGALNLCGQCFYQAMLDISGVDHRWLKQIADDRRQTAV